MKKIFTMALLAAAALSANAEDYVVYNDGVLNPEVTPYSWWNDSFNFSAENPTNAALKVLSFKANDGGAAASMGMLATTDVTGPLHSSTLAFDLYYTGTGKMTVRLTALNSSPEQNYDIEMTAENAGKWVSYNLNVAEFYPEIAKMWDEYKGNGSGYVFSIVLDNAVADTQIFVSNIRYVGIDTSWKKPYIEVASAPDTVPVAEYPAADVVSLLSGNYAPATAFNIGGWGQATAAEIVKIDGADVEHVTNFNYLGWEFIQHIDVTKCNYMHVDYYPVVGDTFGFTPISPRQEKANNYSDLKKGEWNSFDVPLTYWENVDFADLYQIKFDNGNLGEGYIANVFFYSKQGGDTPEEPGEVVRDFGGKVEGVAAQTMDGVERNYPYTVDWSGKWNEDGTITVTAKYNWLEGEPVGLVGGSLVVNNTFSDFVMEDGVRTSTTQAVYAKGDVLNIRTYLPMALGVVETTLNDNMTVEVEAVEVAESEAEYYTLQGVKTVNPAPGIYVRVQNGKAVKVLVK